MLADDRVVGQDRRTPFLMKHSCTAEGEETTTTRFEPSRREKIVPCFRERGWKVRWSGVFRRWRWQRIGDKVGLVVGFSHLDVVV